MAFFHSYETPFTNTNYLRRLHLNHWANSTLVGTLVDEQAEQDIGTEVLWGAIPYTFGFILDF